MIKAQQQILASDFIITVVAGEALSARDALYIDAADGKAYKCDADVLTKMNFVGFAQEAASISANVNVVNHGIMGGFSSLTINAPYYISGTAGAITTTAPANVGIVGIALTATTIKIFDGIKRTNVLYFTTTGANTWTKRPGLLYIDVEVQAAGGGGGGGSDTAGNRGSGGGGGGYSKKRIYANALGSTETATVGDGGAGSTTGTATTGGTSSFGSHCSATGGTGGTGNNGTPGSGGTGSSGDFNLSGGAGIRSTDTGTVNGNGGVAFYGGSVLGKITNSADNGLTGASYGGGGGGGARNSTGGTGGQGIIIVTEYYM